MIGILVGSHGNFAKEALNSAQMIVGEQPNVNAYAVTEDLDLQGAIKAAQSAFDQLTVKDSGVIILTDIVGGTPANVAKVISRHHSHTVVLAGFNLPTLISLLLQREHHGMEALVEFAEKEFGDSLVKLS